MRQGIFRILPHDTTNSHPLSLLCLPLTLPELVTYTHTTTTTHTIATINNKTTI